MAAADPSTYEYSICTIVTKPDEYAEMKASFYAKGFNDGVCEYLSADNSRGNVYTAYEAVNSFLLNAAGRYIIICHQDVLLVDDDIHALGRQIEQVDEIDSNWGVLGNAGARADARLVVRISDPYGENQLRGGPLPAKVVSLDENFIVVRRSANLAVSRDLSGFHFYGADICVIADILGWTAYVIDFHLRHKSPGSFDPSLWAARRQIADKYARALRPRWVHGVTRTPFYLAGSTRTQRRAYWIRQVQKLLGLAPRKSQL